MRLSQGTQRNQITKGLRAFCFFMLKTFYHSLFDTDWLAAQRNRFGRAWLYVLVFMAAVSAVSTAVIVRTIKPVLVEVKTKIEQNAPDFQAELKSGVLTVNGPQQWEIKENDINIVLDVRTTSTTAIENYRSANEAVILLTSTTLSVYDNETGSTRVVPLSSYGEGSWTKADLLTAVDWVVTRGPTIVGAILFFAMWLLGTIGKALYVGLVTLVWHLVLRRNPAFAAAWTHRQVWTVGLYALTLPTLIQQIEQWTGFAIPGFYTLILATIIYLVLRTPVVPAEPESAQRPAPADTSV